MSNLDTRKREDYLKGKVREHFDKSFVWISHQDAFTTGIPDVSTSGQGYTHWWEFKHATPKFETPDIQLLTCMRLDFSSFCRYVIFWEESQKQRTLIICPRHLQGTCDLEELSPLASMVFNGFDFAAVALFMKRSHYARSR